MTEKLPLLGKVSRIDLSCFLTSHNLVPRPKLNCINELSSRPVAFNPIRQGIRGPPLARLVPHRIHHSSFSTCFLIYQNLVYSRKRTEMSKELRELAALLLFTLKSFSVPAVVSSLDSTKPRANFGKAEICNCINMRPNSSDAQRYIQVRTRKVQEQLH